MMIRFVSIVCSLGIFVFSSMALAQEREGSPEVVEYRLDNGLTILVRPNFRAPVVSSQLWYKVGSSYEYSGISGISHMLEHMMFKGTEKYPSGEFSSIVARNGGNHNAFTSRDYTAYYQNISSEHLAKILELEADRMQGIIWDEEEFAKERKVVMEERKLRTDDNPNSRLYESFYVNGFALNPYRIPVIGWMSDIENYQMEDAQKWFEQWYGPNNAVLVVVGAVQPEIVRELAEKYFAHIPAREIPQIKPRIEPVSTTERRYEMLADVQYSLIMIGYKIPSWSMMSEQEGNEDDVFALLLISALMDSGGSSRLPTELVNKQRVASQSGAYYNLISRLQNMIVFDGVTAEGKPVEQLESALFAQIQRLKTELVSQEELRKIKVQIKASSVYGKDSLFYQGYELGALEAVGIGWEKSKGYLPSIDKVTAEDIRRVSEKYFRAENRIVAILRPRDTDK